MLTVFFPIDENTKTNEILKFKRSNDATIDNQTRCDDLMKRQACIEVERNVVNENVAGKYLK